LKVLIKLGGTLLDSAEKVQSIASQLASVGHERQIAVVHGGGKEVTRFLAERGVESRFQNGLRVSDLTVVDAVTKVIAGTVNKRLVSALIAAGKQAVGLSGVDGLLTRAVQLDPALEFVGQPVDTDGKLLDLLVNAGYLPTIACVAGDASGNIYNVNADTMAVSVALGWQASKLFFLTDVPGVKDQSGSLVPELTPAAIEDLVRSGVATGGMQAKLEAASVALGRGIEVSIVSGSESRIIPRLLGGEAIGTRLTGAVREISEARAK
jgi:acetylglutamate kinase